MIISIPQGAQLILDMLQQNSGQAYIVGGCVRDSLLMLQPKDWDICTDLSPDKVVEIFRLQGYTVIETGLKHGTVSIIMCNQCFEVTTFRHDGQYLDNRRPSNVNFVKNIELDLSRRDFTINSMAYSDKTQLLDLFGGQADLKNGYIKCVGVPNERFNEDALRIMRALRFAAVYDFVIENKTKESIHFNKHLLKNISCERINVELSKLLLGKGAPFVLQQYCDVICEIIPEIKFPIGMNTLKTIDNMPNVLVLKLAALFQDIGKLASFSENEIKAKHSKISAQLTEKILKRLKFENYVINTVLTLIEYHDIEIHPDNITAKTLLNKLGIKNTCLLLQFKKACILTQNNEYVNNLIIEIEEMEQKIKLIISTQQCFSLEGLAINGNDLIKAGVPKGKKIGSILNTLLNAVINEQVENNTEKLLIYVKKRFDLL